MNSIDGLKTCRKGLHQYPADKKRCPECSRASSRRWRQKNPDRRQEYNRQWRKQNPDYDRLYYQQNHEQQLEYDRRYREQNRERMRELERLRYKQNSEQQRKKSQQWRQQNPERQRDNNRRWREQNPNYSQQWREQNPDKTRAYKSRRRALQKQAAPPWADYTAINAIYDEAVRLEKETGIKYEVDHIYPLQSDYMCGLHVETNLQILTVEENRSKGNRTWPGQLECQRLSLKENGFDLMD